MKLALRPGDLVVPAPNREGAYYVWRIWDNENVQSKGTWYHGLSMVMYTEHGWSALMLLNGTIGPLWMLSNSEEYRVDVIA